MPKRLELAERLLDLLQPGSDVEIENVEAILTPNADTRPSEAAEVAAVVRGGRPTLSDALNETLMGDQLEGLLGGGVRQAIDANLNSRFPPRKAISTEFLDLVVKRIQALEEQNRLLAAVVVELVYPLDRQARPDACASSRNRRGS